MRGKAGRGIFANINDGITPAYAGKRGFCNYDCYYFRDHPRVCGEKYAPASLKNSRSGSPPRMRGKGWNPCWRGLLNRITPAYAGKSISSGVISLRPGDHPRVCGEKGHDQHPLDLAEGSPPRMRGKGQGMPILAAMSRITPAYAGKSGCGGRNRRVSWDHPRVCGEKCGQVSWQIVCRGSPPRMRGKASFQNNFTTLP